MTHAIQFEYPLPAQLSKHADLLDEKIDGWLQEYDCLPTRLKEKLRRGRFGNLAAHFFPLATLPQLIFMTRWNLAFFAFDDFYGPLPLPELIEKCNRATAILRGAPIQKEDNEIFRQIAIMRSEYLPYVADAPHWQAQFVRSMALFFEGMQLDTRYSYKEVVRYPSIQEYLVLREKIVATYPLLDFVEIETGTILPEELLHDPVVRRVRQLACRLVSWSNDIYSLEKELEDHEAMNLVLVIQHEQGVSTEEAIQQAAQIHDDDLAEFAALVNQKLHYGNYTAAVQRYFEGISLLLSGHIAWYDHTFRY